jgi:hypothetical protein
MNNDDDIQLRSLAVDEDAEVADMQRDWFAFIPLYLDFQAHN